jgi:DNA-binding transcriptional ArsR family regulator
LGNERRLQILEWLKKPKQHFPPRRRSREGRCLRPPDRAQVARHQPAITEHLKILSQAGFLKSKRIKKWTFYKRDEKAINTIKRSISKCV